MSVNKEQSGYTRASISAQALGGAVPVIDLNTKGGLQKLFASKSPGGPFADSPAAKAAALNEAAPRQSAPSQNQPQNQPQARQQAAAEKEAPEPERNEPAPAAQAATDNDRDDKTPDNRQSAAMTAAASYRAFVPPAFAPILAAGELSALHHEKAIDIAQGPDGYKQGDEFKFGSAAGRQQRRIMERIENTMEAGREDGRTNSRDILMQYAAEQQRQQFMRSTEYAVAMQTVDRNIRELQLERETVTMRIADLQAKRADLTQKIEIATADVEKKEEEVADLEGVQRLQVQNQADKENLDNTYARVDQVYAKANELWDASLKIEGKDIIYTTVEDGKPVKYKVDENGQKQKTEASGGYDHKDQIYSKKLADGSIKYVDINGQDVDKQTKDMIDARLAAAGVKPEDVLPDHDALTAETAKAEALAKEGKADSEGIIKAWNTAEDSGKALSDEAERLGLSKDDLTKLDNRIAGMKDYIANKKAEIEKWKQEGTKTDEELAKEQKSLDLIDKRLAESTKFKEQLQSKTFKDAAEMQDAMPSYLKPQYEENLAQAKKNNPSATAAATADNTSRANGSAAASYDGASSPANGAISDKFQTAAAATGSAPAAAPEAPAPDNDMEYIAARQQPKAQAAGMAP